MKGHKLINRRGMLGAAIAEYLPLLSLVLLIVVGGAVQYAEELRRHAANVSEELAGEGGIGDIGIGGPGGAGGGGGSGSGGGSTSGGTPGSGTGGSSGGATTPTGPGGGTTTGPGDSGGTTPGDSLVDLETPPTTPGDTPSEGAEGGATGEESVLASVGRFIEGLWDGVKTQFWGLAEMLLSPIETAKNLKELAVSFVTDPEGTIEVVVSELKEDFDALTSDDPYEVGRVIGENVSPAALARIAGRLATLSKSPAIVAKRDSVAKELDKECSSFLAGTLVWTNKGLLPIEKLAVGDIVMGRDDKTFEDAPQRISKLFNREVSRYYELDTGYEKILVTEEHPYWLQGQGWTPVAELKAGDVLARAEGDIQVHKIKFIQGPASVYNFTVEKTHSYFVGPNKLWVHNVTCPLDVASTKLDEIKKTIPEELKEDFKEDFEGTEAGELLERNPDLANEWVKLKDSTNAHLSADADVLEALGDAQKIGIDGVDALADAAEVVGKTKPTWPELMALFKRGNDFNEKARDLYEYNEIVLKNGKRLDSYIPGEAIISRKATTLSEIKLSTFEGYLKELTTKYKKGEELNSSKLPKGETLDGAYKLEIPSSNKDFYESSAAMKELAEKYNVEVIFLDE